MEITKELEERIMLDDDATTKLFLFREFAKLEELKNELSEQKKALEQKEKELSKKEKEIALDTKALMDKELFFEKKMQILKDGYLVLDQDKRRLEIERAQFETEKQRHADVNHPRSDRYRDAFSQVEFREDAGFFAGVTNVMALKKRYKDLMKIYHPDNCCGDQDTLVMIKSEYENLLEYYG